MTSLRARITLVTVGVAVVAVLITGLVSLGLVRSATTDEAREQLAAQAEVVAESSDPVGVAERWDAAPTVAGVVRDGTAAGDAAAYVNTGMLRDLADGGAVSVTRRGPLGPAMVEARPVDDRTAVMLVRPLSSVDRALGRATNRILIALAIGLAVAIGAALVLSRVIAAPLTRAADAARRLAAGERGVAVPVATTTEVAAVTDALAALDRALATSEGRQREFLTSISHDLRTPLTALRGYGEALADGLVTDVPAVGRTLVAETSRLDAFVADLLELARLDADDFTIRPEPVDVDAVIAEAATAWRGRAGTLGVTIVTTGGYGTAITDARRLRQVIDGLLENALRISPDGSTVELRAVPGRIEVLDEGPGLDPADLPVAFDRGILRDRYRDARPVGTGLGLSIAARLVHRLGGAIEVTNRPGGGAAFAVSLPRDTPAARLSRSATRPGVS